MIPTILRAKSLVDLTWGVLWRVGGAALVVVLIALLTRLLLLRWSALGRRMASSTVLSAALTSSATAILVLVGVDAWEWVDRNGFRWNGVCSGGPPDVTAHLCRFAPSPVKSPFAMVAVYALMLFWTSLWCWTWGVAADLRKHGPVLRRGARRAVNRIAERAFSACRGTSSSPSSTVAPAGSPHAGHRACDER